MSKKRHLAVGQRWRGDNRKCLNRGGTKEIVALSTVKGKAHESRVYFLDQHGRKTWCTRASFVGWIRAYKALIVSCARSSPGPSVIIKQIASDGWEAWIEDRQLIRAVSSSPVGAFDSVMSQLAQPVSEKLGEGRG